jgi:hypothetical protein
MLLRHFPEHTHAHTHSLLLHQIRAATPDLADADAWAQADSERGRGADAASREEEKAQPSVEEKREGQPSVEKRRREGPAHGGEEAGPRRSQAEPAHDAPSQPLPEPAC